MHRVSMLASDLLLAVSHCCAWQGVPWDAAWASKAAFRSYAQLHIMALGLAGDVDSLQALAASLRKRTRLLQPGSQQQEVGRSLPSRAPSCRRGISSHAAAMRSAC